MSNRMGDLNLALALEGRAKAASNNEQLVVIAEALANLPDPEIDQSFMLALEQRILTEDLGRTSAARRLQVVPVISPTPADEVVRRAPVVQMPKRRFVVRRSMVAVAACMSLAAFPLVAAASSLPGSPFHGIKTSIEKMWIALTGTPTEDAFAHMSLAQVRIGEAEQLTAMHADPARVELALAMAEKQMNLAQSQIFGITDDPAVLRKMAEEARVTELQLRHAAGALKADGGAAFTDALELSVGIQDAVAIALGLEPGLPA